MTSPNQNTDGSTSPTGNASNPAHNDVVDAQFGSQANLYLTSSVHAKGAEFALVADIIRQIPKARVLDLGSGAGHISFCAAPVADEVIAYDLSNDMLEVVKQTATEKGLNNVSVKKGLAEHLDFADNSFDVVVSRFSAHHWQDVPQALKEAKRVCKAGGIVIMIDVMAPANPLCDTFLQTIEILRDNSHVRDYSIADWQSMFSQAGLNTTQMQTHKLRLEFESWVTRMRTPALYIDAISQLQQNIGQEALDYFDVQADGTFTTDVITLVATA